VFTARSIEWKLECKMAMSRKAARKARQIRLVLFCGNLALDLLNADNSLG
jgi:hypothetical protein